MNKPTEEMGREEINAWTDGPWDCVCGHTSIDGSFGCPSCKLTIIGSSAEKRKRNREAWEAFAKAVNDEIKDAKLEELIKLRDLINEAIEEAQKRE